MQWFGVGRTDVGRKRQNNEDAFHVDNALGLYVVCDGMGGHQGGEVASRMAVDAVARIVSERRETLERARDYDADTQELATLLADAIRTANDEIHARGSSKNELAGMGCALTAVVFVGDKGVVGHVGDTRLYRFRDGHVDQVTTDHTMASELVRSGAVPVEEQHRLPHGHVLTRAVGSKPSVEVDTLVVNVVPGERFLLCSDGLSGYLEDSGTLVAHLGAAELETVPDALVRLANDAGGRDNITVVVVGAKNS